MLVTPLSVVRTAATTTKATYSDRRFKSTYGFSLNIVAIAWNEIQDSNDCKESKVTLKDFPMALFFLKIIITRLFFLIFRTTEKIYRIHIKKSFILISNLRCTCWGGRT